MADVLQLHSSSPRVLPPQGSFRLALHVISILFEHKIAEALFLIDKFVEEGLISADDKTALYLYFGWMGDEA